MLSLDKMGATINFEVAIKKTAPVNQAQSALRQN
jgi:hypothetical protein